MVPLELIRERIVTFGPDGKGAPQFAFFGMGVCGSLTMARAVSSQQHGG
jgi:hypothetical protein